MSQWFFARIGITFWLAELFPAAHLLLASSFYHTATQSRDIRNIFGFVPIFSFPLSILSEHHFYITAHLSAIFAIVAAFLTFFWLGTQKVPPK